MAATSSSDAITEPSSPVNASSPIASPPSSPPTFPWEVQHDAATSPHKKQSPDRSTNSIVSILGKRKAALQETQHNARATKRVLISQRCHANGKKQMQLSFGQKIEETCKTCGMVYVKSQAEDRKLHDAFHNAAEHGVPIGGELVRKSAAGRSIRVACEALAKSGKYDAMCVIMKDDPKWRRKHARTVLDVITSSLGAVPITDEELWEESSTVAYEVYMYVREGRCISAVVVESLDRRVRKFMKPEVKLKTNVAGLDALAQLQVRREAEKALDPQAWRPSDETYCVPRGIARIWTAPALRGQGLATALLEYAFARRASTPGMDGRMQELAFSQPTDAGIRLARRWFGQQYGWYVY